MLHIQAPLTEYLSKLVGLCSSSDGELLIESWKITKLEVLQGSSVTKSLEGRKEIETFVETLPQIGSGILLKTCPQCCYFNYIFIRQHCFIT